MTSASGSDVLYFAYGCNMNPALLAAVLGMGVNEGRAARADGWSLVFNKGGEGDDGKSVAANLVEDEGSVAYGVVYAIPREALAALDAFEEVPEHYRRHTLWIEPLDGATRQAVLTYLAQPRWVVEPGLPPPDYLSHLRRGASIHGLPSHYIEQSLS